ncbi:MAG: hypothetical protein LH660_06210 [Phormidesmis sp. CAN_BIN36]|nr:hypothetical protein [Phormidesmis sp. CAN_BIN36]
MSNSDQALRYPDTQKIEQTDDYHGVSVSDPYCWLEDADSDETKAWVEYLNRIRYR